MSNLHPKINTITDFMAVVSKFTIHSLAHFEDKKTIRVITLSYVTRIPSFKTFGSYNRAVERAKTSHLIEMQMSPESRRYPYIVISLLQEVTKLKDVPHVLGYVPHFNRGCFKNEITTLTNNEIVRDPKPLNVKALVDDIFNHLPKQTMTNG